MNPASSDPMAIGLQPTERSSAKLIRVKYKTITSSKKQNNDPTRILQQI